jgi:hypothetical protein
MDTTSLATTAQARMDHARPAAHSRSAQTVHGCHDRALRQTVVALRATLRVARDRLRRSHDRPRPPLDLAETVFTFSRHGWSESHGNG